MNKYYAGHDSATGTSCVKTSLKTGELVVMSGLTEDEAFQYADTMNKSLPVARSMAKK
jgi:hypothetical protein